MDADSARGHLNAVLYGVDFHPDLKLDAARWPDFAGTRAVARVDLDIHQLTGLLNRRPDEVDGERRPVAIVELRSGEVVALLGPAGRPARRFTFLRRDAGDPAEILARFCEDTNLAPERATLLPQ
ncbi:hypothetical protein [Phytohabitans houttuyneae]|nr:hypothetical protein [Phytohabitans houttuyneae]